MKLLILLLLSTKLFAASVKGAFVEATIDAVPGSDTALIYSYTIVNGGGSRDSVKTLSIDVSGRSASIPAHSLSTPANWTFMGLGTTDELTWAAADSGVPVGRSAGPMKIKSEGLPGVRSYRLAPSMEHSKVPFSPPKDGGDLKAYLHKMDEFKHSIEARGVTLAPGAPPSPFIPLAFIDILTENFNQVVSQGLIRNQSVAQDLSGKLRNIRIAIENKNEVDAKNLASAFVTKLGFQKAEALAPEVIALLKHNLRYFINQLSKK